MPIVGFVIVFEKVDGLYKTLRRGIVFVAFGVHELSVDPIGTTVFASKFWNVGIVDQGMPHITFLAAHKFPRVEAGMVTFAATVEVVIVVGDHVGIGACLTVELWLQTIVPGLDG